MNPGYCPPCGIHVPRDELRKHVENYHIGPPSSDRLFFVCCGGCEYRVPENSSVLMMEHCFETGHSAEEITIDWSIFLDVETTRLKRILINGVQTLMAGKRIANNTYNDTKDGLISHKESSNTVKIPNSLDWPNHSADPGKDLKVRDQLSMSTSQMDIFNSGKAIVKEELNVSSSMMKIEGETELDINGSFILKQEENEMLTRQELRNIRRRRLRGGTTRTIQRARRSADSLQWTCQICTKILYYSENRWKKRCAITHAVFHCGCDFLKCANYKYCGYTCSDRDVLLKHSRKPKYVEMGCDGSFISMQTQEKLNCLLSKLNMAFPEKDWTAELKGTGSFRGIEF